MSGSGASETPDSSLVTSSVPLGKNGSLKSSSLSAGKVASLSRGDGAIRPDARPDVNTGEFALTYDSSPDFDNRAVVNLPRIVFLCIALSSGKKLGLVTPLTVVSSSLVSFEPTCSSCCSRTLLFIP